MYNLNKRTDKIILKILSKLNIITNKSTLNCI